MTSTWISDEGEMTIRLNVRDQLSQGNNASSRIKLATTGVQIQYSPYWGTSNEADSPLCECSVSDTCDQKNPLNYDYF